jgi:hypothetical protein
LTGTTITNELARLSSIHPFPLYPGEILVGGLRYLDIVHEDEALLLRAIRNYKDVENKINRKFHFLDFFLSL